METAGDITLDTKTGKEVGYTLALLYMVYCNDDMLIVFLHVDIRSHCQNVAAYKPKITECSLAVKCSHKDKVCATKMMTCPHPHRVILKSRKTGYHSIIHSWSLFSLVCPPLELTTASVHRRGRVPNWIGSSEERCAQPFFVPLCSPSVPL